MNKGNSIGAIEKTDLSEQTKFRLDETSKIENYFIEEINQRKSCSKKLNKYVAVFDYIDQALIALSATSGGDFIYNYCWGTSWNSKCKPFFIFFSNNKNSQNITEYSKKKKRKNMIKFLSWLKVNLIALKH